MSTIGSPPLLYTLSELVAQGRHLADDARHLIDRAQAVCAQAAEVTATSQLHRQDRASWATVIARLPADPDRLVMLCVYCHRLKGADGWMTLPTGIESELKAWEGARVSHGYCPDCLRDHSAPIAPHG